MNPYGPPMETELSGQDPGVRLASLARGDAAHLALHDVDLSGCRFAGASHLDQLKVDGWCTFASTPADGNRRFPWRWSRRTVLAEEHHWRIRTARHPTGPPPGAGHRRRPTPTSATTSAKCAATMSPGPRKQALLTATGPSPTMGCTPPTRWPGWGSHGRDGRGDGAVGPARR